MAVLLLLVTTAAGCATGIDQQQAAQGRTLTPTWTLAADSPLSPRHGALVVTVGEEVLVLGGDSSPPCPPAASCAAPPATTLRKDGAAWSPADDTWRRLPDAPVLPAGGSAAVVDDALYLLAEGQLHSYDRASDAWSRLPAPPDDDGYLLPAGEQLLRLEPTQEGGQVQADHLYDPRTRRWQALPHDPLAPAFDRTAVWTGEQLVLLGKPVPPPAKDGVDSPTVYLHAATYAPGARHWTAVAQQDTVIGFGSQAVWTGDRVALPYGFDYTDGGRNAGGTPDPTGGYLDPATGQWEPLARTPPPSPTALRVQALSDTLVTTGEGFVLDLDRRTWHALEPAPGAATAGVRGTWIDRRLAVFGGSTIRADGAGALSDQLRVWQLVEES